MVERLDEMEMVFCSGENKETPHTRVEDENSVIWYKCDSCEKLEYVSIDHELNREVILADSPLPF